MITKTRANGINFTIQMRPQSLREREAIADNIQADPDATEFNKKHPHHGVDDAEVKRKPLRKRRVVRKSKV